MVQIFELIKVYYNVFVHMFGIFINPSVLRFISALPGHPVITNFPKTAIEGHDLQVRCTSVGGVPSPNVTWYRESVFQDITWTTTGGATFNDYSFEVSFAYRNATFSCVSQNAYTDPSLQQDIKFDHVFGMHLYVELLIELMYVWLLFMSLFTCLTKFSLACSMLFGWSD